jgi:hypothetical protein
MLDDSTSRAKSLLIRRWSFSTRPVPVGPRAQRQSGLALLLFQVGPSSVESINEFLCLFYFG